VVDEDVVCWLFTFTLIGVASTWYFILRIGLITSWGAFQEEILDNFGDEKILVALILELSRLKMEAKEKVKDFNIQFNTLFNRIPANTRATDEVLMELYITTLPFPTAMWVKRSNRQTLQGAINEEIKVKNEMISITTCHHTTKEKKPFQSSEKNNGSDNKVAEIKEKDTTYVEGLHQIIMKLTNIIIDMKRILGRVQMGREEIITTENPPNLSIIRR